MKLKLRLSDFTTFTRQRTVEEPIESSEEITRLAFDLLEGEMRPGRLFRLVGVGVSGFNRGQDAGEKQQASQLSLFGFQ